MSVHPPLSSGPSSSQVPDSPSASSPGSNERVFALGLLGNVGLAVLKLGVGFWAGSRALVADGWESMADILTNGGVWLAHRWSKAPPDDDHHYGHGNAEPLAGLLVGVVLMLGGVFVVWDGLTSDAVLQRGAALYAALGVATLSMIVNVGLTWITWREGQRLRSQGLLALARDNASDVLTAWLVIIGILGSWMGFPWTELAAAIAIGLLIVWMGLSSARSGLDVLMDRAPDPALRDALSEHALGVEGVRGVQSVRIHPVGAQNRVDMEISVDGTLTVARGHEIAHQVEDEIVAAHSDVAEVHVHVNPLGHGVSASEGQASKS